MLQCIIRRFCPVHLSVAYFSCQALVPSSEYLQRRQRLVECLRQTSVGETDKPLVVVARASPRHYFAPDVPYPYYQCSYFRYLTGYLQPDAILLIIAESEKPTSILYVQERTEKEELWEGPSLKAKDIQQIGGFDEVKNRQQLFPDLLPLLTQAVVSFDSERIRQYGDPLLEVLSGCDNILPLRGHLDALRWIKSPVEQKLMYKTCKIGAQGMNAVISQSRGVANENEIVGRLEYEFRRRGAACSAYPPVVAAANRANTIHYLDADKNIGPTDTVLVDAGCMINGYASDITRIFPVSGHFTASQLAIYDVLNDVQARLLYIAKTVRPLKLIDLYSAMMESMAYALRASGIFAQSLSEAESIHEANNLCPHHVSHYLGMDVHDTASVSRSIPLKPGVAFTVEPGIYVRYDNEKIKKEFRGIGMRIEDDILIRNHESAVIMTDDAVRDADDIELLMTSDRIDKDDAIYLDFFDC